MRPAAVFCLDNASLPTAKSLADSFELPLMEAGEIEVQSSKDRRHFLQEHLLELPALAYLVDSDALQLVSVEEQGILAISANFHGASIDYRREKGGGRSELIARAVGLKSGKLPTVIDATAGLGVDAFVLASLGCQVTLLERSPEVSALLRDGLERSRQYAKGHNPKLETILGRMQLIQTEAIKYLNRLGETDFPDVVYLDPMFPERKKSAAVKKEMQIFHRLIGPDEDADSLFEAALARTRERVVVKRPRVANSLAGPKPNHVIEGKRNRYDVYLTT